MPRYSELLTFVIGVVLAIILRLTGVITNLPIAIGAVTLVVGYMTLEQRFLDGRAKTVVRASYAAMVVLIIISFAWNWGWGYYPRTGEGTTRAQQASDIRGQELTRTPAVIAIDAFQQSCNKVDDELGREITEKSKAYEAMAEAVRRASFDKEKLKQELEKWRDGIGNLIRQNREHREKCSVAILGWNPPAKRGGSKTGNVAGESSEFVKFFRNTWESYRSKLAIDQLAWALIAFAAVALVARAFMRRGGAVATAAGTAATRSGTKTEYSIMIVWVGAAAFLAALTAFYGMGHWLIPAIVLGTAVLWAIIHGKNQSWQNGLVMACIIWGMTGLGLALVWGVLWDAHSQEQYFRAGTRSAVSWIIGGRPLP